MATSAEGPQPLPGAKEVSRSINATMRKTEPPQILDDRQTGHYVSI